MPNSASYGYRIYIRKAWDRGHCRVVTVHARNEQEARAMVELSPVECILNVQKLGRVQWETKAVYR